MSLGRRLIPSLALAMAVSVVTASAALADAGPTRADATAMVKAAVASLKSGVESAALAEISDPASKYHKGDLYLVAYDMSGKVLAHGFLKSLIGKDLTNAKDADGKAYVKERIEMAGSEKSFWQSYKYLDPATKQIRLKDSYCERAGDAIVCGGVYH